MVPSDEVILENLRGFVTEALANLPALAQHVDDGPLDLNFLDKIEVFVNDHFPTMAPGMAWKLATVLFAETVIDRIPAVAILMGPALNREDG